MKLHVGSKLYFVTRQHHVIVLRVSEVVQESDSEGTYYDYKVDLVAPQDGYAQAIVNLQLNRQGILGDDDGLYRTDIFRRGDDAFIKATIDAKAALVKAEHDVNILKSRIMKLEKKIID